MLSLAYVSDDGGRHSLPRSGHLQDDASRGNRRGKKAGQQFRAHRFAKAVACTECVVNHSPDNTTLRKRLILQEETEPLPGVPIVGCFGCGWRRAGCTREPLCKKQIAVVSLGCISCMCCLQENKTTHGHCRNCHHLLRKKISAHADAQTSQFAGSGLYTQIQGL